MGIIRTTEKEKSDNMHVVQNGKSKQSDITIMPCFFSAFLLAGGSQLSVSWRVKETSSLPPLPPLQPNCSCTIQG